MASAPKFQGKTISNERLTAKPTTLTRQTLPVNHGLQNRWFAGKDECRGGIWELYFLSQTERVGSITTTFPESHRKDALPTESGAWLSLIFRLIFNYIPLILGILQSTFICSFFSCAINISGHPYSLIFFTLLQASASKRRERTTPRRAHALWPASRMRSSRP